MAGPADRANGRPARRLPPPLPSSTEPAIDTPARTTAANSNPVAPAASPRGTADVAAPWTVEQLVDRLPGARLDRDDEAAGYGPQLRFDGARAAGATVLVEYGLLRIDGADAKSFLQGQLTNDVGLADDRRALATGYCSPKGRMLGTFWFWRDGNAGDAGYLLACSRELAPALLKRLRMFVLRAKVRIASLDATHAMVGLVGADAVAAGPALAQAVGAAAPIDWPGVPAQAGSAGVARASFVVGGDDLGRLADAVAGRGIGWVDTAAWRRLEVDSAVARVTAGSVERFVPQMVNFERTGGVSFTKGCYPGQEIVARSQYLGTLKRRMFLADGRGTLPAPGRDVRLVGGSADAEAPGTVVLAARAPQVGPDAFRVLFEARLAAVDDGFEIDGHRLALCTLPYALTDDATAS